MGPPPSASKQFEALQSDVNDYFPHAITIHAGDSIGFQPGFHNVDFPKRGGKYGAFIAPRAGATLKERFGWWPVATHRLDRSSRTTFKPTQRNVRARVVLTLPNGGTMLATSSELELGRVRRGRPAPRMPMHH